MTEQSPGNYIGRYVVQPGDELEDAVVEISAIRASDKARTFWRVSGRIQFDTQKPVPLQQLKGRASDQGIQLSWQSQQDGGSAISYQIERADIKRRPVPAHRRNRHQQFPRIKTRHWNTPTSIA